ncbi:hypothetical protein EPO33_02020 [Patescibacteria group bacterium]|nr:MAG: hypothetical protein EPO33_02020 [Patescibacteria group bacterium]
MSRQSDHQVYARPLIIAFFVFWAIFGGVTALQFHSGLPGRFDPKTIDGKGSWVGEEDYRCSAPGGLYHTCDKDRYLRQWKLAIMLRAIVAFPLMVLYLAIVAAVNTLLIVGRRPKVPESHTG